MSFVFNFLPNYLSSKEPVFTLSEDIIKILLQSSKNINYDNVIIINKSLKSDKIMNWGFFPFSIDVYSHTSFQSEVNKYIKLIKQKKLRVLFIYDNLELLNNETIQELMQISVSATFINDLSNIKI